MRRADVPLVPSQAEVDPINHQRHDSEGHRESNCGALRTRLLMNCWMRTPPPAKRKRRTPNPERLLQYSVYH